MRSAVVKKARCGFEERRSAPNTDALHCPNFPAPFLLTQKEPAGVPLEAGGRVQALSDFVHGTGRQAGARSAVRWAKSSPNPDSEDS